MTGWYCCTASGATAGRCGTELVPESMMLPPEKVGRWPCEEPGPDLMDWRRLFLVRVTDCPSTAPSGSLAESIIEPLLSMTGTSSKPVYSQSLKMHEIQGLSLGSRLLWPIIAAAKHPVRAGPIQLERIVCLKTLEDEINSWQGSQRDRILKSIFKLFPFLLLPVLHHMCDSLRCYSDAWTNLQDLMSASDRCQRARSGDIAGAYLQLI